MSRPYYATLTVRCFSPGCDCVRTVPVRLTEGADNGQVVERQYEKECPVCDHRTMAHATVEIDKGNPIERRQRPR